MRFKVLFLVVLLFPIAGFAQEFNGGLLAGISTTQVDGDGLGGYNRIGANAGVWVSRTFSRTIALRAELKFIQKGSHKRFTDGAGGTTGEYSLRLNYTELPVLVEYHFRDDIIPFGGISFGYLWNWTEKNNGYENPVDEGSQFRKAELAAQLGVEYRLNPRFSFCAAFSYSMVPVRRHTGDIYYFWNFDFGQYNNVLQFYFRYHF